MHAHRILVFIATATAAFADKPPPPKSQSAASAPIVATLKRTACYGHCPVYSLLIRADGTVEYEGERCVKIAGQHMGKLDVTAMKSLSDAFAAARYFALDDKEWRTRHADRHCSSDASYAIISYRDQHRFKHTQHYNGCHNAPKALTELEHRIDEIVGVERWIGTAAEWQNQMPDEVPCP